MHVVDGETPSLSPDSDSRMPFLGDEHLAASTSVPLKGLGAQPAARCLTASPALEQRCCPLPLGW